MQPDVSLPSAKYFKYLNENFLVSVVQRFVALVAPPQHFWGSFMEKRKHLALHHVHLWITSLIKKGFFPNATPCLMKPNSAGAVFSHTSCNVMTVCQQPLRMVRTWYSGLLNKRWLSGAPCPRRLLFFVHLFQMPRHFLNSDFSVTFSTPLSSLFSPEHLSLFLHTFWHKHRHTNKYARSTSERALIFSYRFCGLYRCSESEHHSLNELLFKLKKVSLHLWLQDSRHALYL